MQHHHNTIATQTYTRMPDAHVFYLMTCTFPCGKYYVFVVHLCGVLSNHKVAISWWATSNGIGTS